MLVKSRYDIILQIIEKLRPRSIIEVGTWNGLRACEMLRAAREVRPRVDYIGYDLFGDATSETDAAELNVKAHVKIEDVETTLADFAKSIGRVSINLVKGNTRQTLHGKLPLTGLKKPILAFIDGGHSIETIRGDYLALKGSNAIILDDYYTKDVNGVSPDTEKFGCNKIVKEFELDGICAGGDTVAGGGKVSLFLYPPSIFTGPVQLNVQTKNCVPDERIRANIGYSISLIKDWLAPCDEHSGAAVFVSAGPSLKGSIEDIRLESKDTNNFIICVKHAHDELIANGIIPYACVLLDPRPHVQDFIENPHPGVKYLVASMVHPTTIDQLINNKALVYGYHALVGAGEDKCLPPKSYMINGGTTSAIRGISVFHFLGFRKFRLYAFDSSYVGVQDTKAKTKTGAQKFYEGTYFDKKFWSDAELIAQVQDMIKLLDTAPAIDLEVFGDGLLQHVVRTKCKSAVPHFGRGFDKLYGRGTHAAVAA